MNRNCGPQRMILATLCVALSLGAVTHAAPPYVADLRKQLAAHRYDGNDLHYVDEPHALHYGVTRLAAGTVLYHRVLEPHRAAWEAQYRADRKKMLKAWTSGGRFPGVWTLREPGYGEPTRFNHVEASGYKTRPVEIHLKRDTDFVILLPRSWHGDDPPLDIHAQWLEHNGGAERAGLGDPYHTMRTREGATVYDALKLYRMPPERRFYRELKLDGVSYYEGHRHSITGRPDPAFILLNPAAIDHVQF